MREVVSIRKPKGSVHHTCPGCNLLILADLKGRERELAFVQKYDGDRWVGTDVFHGDCYRRVKKLRGARRARAS